MMDNQTPRFTKEQLRFFIDTVLSGSLDRVETCLPGTIPRSDWDDRSNAHALRSFIDGAVQAAQTILANLFSRLTGAEMSLGFADALNGFEKEVDRILLARLRNDASAPPLHCRRLAGFFVTRLLEHDASSSS